MIELAHRADQSVKGKIVQCFTPARLRPPQHAAQIRHGEGTMVAHAGKRPAGIGPDPAEQPRLPAVGRHCGHGQAMMDQDMLDGLVMIFPQALENHEVGGSHRQEQLGDDLVGAAQVYQLDSGEVQQGGHAGRSGQRFLNPDADGSAECGDVEAARTVLANVIATQ